MYMYMYHRHRYCRHQHHKHYGISSSGISIGIGISISISNNASTSTSIAVSAKTQDKGRHPAALNQQRLSLAANPLEDAQLAIAIARRRGLRYHRQRRRPRFKIRKASRRTSSRRLHRVTSRHPTPSTTSRPKFKIRKASSTSSS